METFFKPSEILESFLIVTTICKSHQGRSSEKRQSLSPNLHFCRDQQYCGGFGMRCVKSTRWNFGISVSLSGVKSADPLPSIQTVECQEKRNTISNNQ